MNKSNNFMAVALLILALAAFVYSLIGYIRSKEAWNKDAREHRRHGGKMPKD